jgi:dTDP-L-rhamnose 4-epimerase
MTARNGYKRVLVTGGAGLIGSHLSDLLLGEGYRVRILDNLEPQTHRNGKPSWIPAEAEFVRADIRDRDAVRSALESVDVVFHQAAYGGYMPEMTKYVHVNSFGTAQMLEVIRDENLPVEKVVVASSQAVYREGAAICVVHGLVFPDTRPTWQLAARDYAVRCPVCGESSASTPTPEEAPMGGETVFAITKSDQERLVLNWGRQTGVPTVALRYSCTYGPRQSIFNPYTGVIAIFATRLLNGQPPVLYEDGEQTRDFCYVGDVARANLLAAQSDTLDGLPVNVGSGQATTIREVARMVSEALDVQIEPVARGSSGLVRCVT